MTSAEGSRGGELPPCGRRAFPLDVEANPWIAIDDRSVSNVTPALVQGWTDGPVSLFSAKRIHRTRSLFGGRLAWRPLQRSTRVAIIGALFATLFYQILLLDPAYRGPLWLWSLMVFAEGLTALHAIGTWWTILAHDDGQAVTRRP